MSVRIDLLVAMNKAHRDPKTGDYLTVKAIYLDGKSVAELMLDAEYADISAGQGTFQGVPVYIVRRMHVGQPERHMHVHAE